MKFFTFIFIISIALQWENTAGMGGSGKNQKLSQDISPDSEIDKDHVVSHTKMHDSSLLGSGSNFEGESSSSSTKQFDENQITQIPTGYYNFYKSVHR